MTEKSIYIAEDHKILRDGLKLILSSIPGVKVVGETGDGRSALSEVIELVPDILLLDISMPSLLGLDVARELFKKNHPTRIIVLTKHMNIEYLKTLLEYDISAYVLKDDAANDLIEAINSVDEDKFYISSKVADTLEAPELRKALLDKKKSGKSLLSHRELEIVKLIGEDKTTDEIAEILQISSKTVKAHRSNIFRKLGISSVTELVKYAVKKGLVEL